MLPLPHSANIKVTGKTLSFYNICDKPVKCSRVPSACGVQCSTKRLVLFMFLY